MTFHGPHIPECNDRCNESGHWIVGDELKLWRRDAGIGVCTDPRRDFGRDYRILHLLARVEAAETALARMEALADEWTKLGGCEWACDQELRAALSAATPEAGQ